MDQQPSNQSSSMDPTVEQTPPPADHQQQQHRQQQLPPDPPTPLTRIPRPATLPRKGILKRSGSAHTPKRGHSTPPDPMMNISGAASIGDLHKASSTTMPTAQSTPIGHHHLQQQQHQQHGGVVRSASAAGDSRAASKIPKLSVTWWETNSICGEAPPSIRSARSSKQFSPPPLLEEMDRLNSDDETNDDVESIQSAASSSIAGNWWFGRTTRYVPHCQRRHMHGDETCQYLTPTQRKNREIGELKNELKRSNKLVDDKEKHLQQLRERLTELERIMDQGGCLLENQRLQAKLNLFKEDADRERRQLLTDHEERMKRMKQAFDRDSTERETTFQFELDEIRSSLEREHQQNQHHQNQHQHQQQQKSILDDRDSGMSSSGLYGSSIIPNVDASTMTDSQSDPLQELHAYRYECMILRNRVSELEFTLKQYEKDLTSDDSCGNKPCATKLRAQSAQLEAYKNECLVWRTKAAEMEIALKRELAVKNQLHLQAQGLQQQIRQLHERQSASSSSNQMRLRSSSSLSSLTKCSVDDLSGLFGSPSKDDMALLFNKTTADDGNGEEMTSDVAEAYKREFIQMRNKAKYLEKQLESTKNKLKTTIGHLKGPCTKELCVNERKRLTTENEQFKNDNRLLIDENETLEKQNVEMKHVGAEREDMLKTSEQVIQNLDQQLTSKRTELEVTQLTFQKLKEENEKLHTEVQDLYGKLANLETIMTDCGIVVHQTTSAAAATARRKHRSSGQQSQQLVYRGREIQTDLTAAEEYKMENDLRDLQESHGVLQAKYDEEKSDLEMKLDEISQNLHLKNSLVGTLTNQIQMLNDEYEAARSGFERERLQYGQKLHDLDLVAQRVPFLEHDVATAREEVQLVETSYEKEKGRFERAMEDSLSESMKTSQQTAEYWKAKLEQSLKQTESYKRRHEQSSNELSDTKMRLNLEKMELERRLHDLHQELGGLKKKMFEDRETVACQTEYLTVDKSISCYVRTETKSTEILDDGELFDERSERLKILQGELQATRRQVEVLQGKLLISETVYQQLEEAEAKLRDTDDTIGDLREEIESMKADRRVDREVYETQVANAMDEKERMAMAEQARIGELEMAFEHVRHELDSVIKRYEQEKLDLRTKMDQKCAEFERALREKTSGESEIVDLRRTIETHVKSLSNLRTELDERNTEIAELKQRLEEERRVKSEELADLGELERRIREMSCECDDFMWDETARKKWLEWKRTKSGKKSGPCPIHHPEATTTGDQRETVDGSIIEPIDQQQSQKFVDAVQSQPSSMDDSDSSVVAEQHRSTSPATKAAITEMRAKILFLLQENQQLRDEFKSLKESVASMIKRHDSLKSQRRGQYVETKSNQPNEDGGQQRRERSTGDNDSSRAEAKIAETKLSMEPKSLDQRPTGGVTNGQRPPEQGIVGGTIDESNRNTNEDDLDSIRDDLEHIAHRFELLADDARLVEEEQNEEAALMQWLKHELAKEKGDMDVLLKWYEGDKRKLDNELADCKRKLASMEDKSSLAQIELDCALVDLHDVSRELELYKLEESNSIGRKMPRQNGSKRRWRSQSDLPRMDSTTKWYHSTLTREFFALQQRMARLSKERDQLQQDLNILRVDHTLLEIEKLESKKPDTNQQQRHREKSTSDPEEFDHLKKQLNQAERCAARLESEATQWMNEVALLKGQIRASRGRMGRGSSTTSIASITTVDEERESGGGDLVKELRRSELASSKLETELARRTRECSDLRKELETMGKKREYAMRRQQQEIDRLRERYDSELKILRNALAQLRQSGGGDESKSSGDAIVVDLRRILDDTTEAMIEKSNELEKLERDVIYLKARLIETNFKGPFKSTIDGDRSTKKVPRGIVRFRGDSNVEQQHRGEPAATSTDDSAADAEFSASSFAAFLDNLKIKHEIEMKSLRQELMDERAKRLGTTGGSIVRLVREGSDGRSTSVDSKSLRDDGRGKASADSKAHGKSMAKKEQVKNVKQSLAEAFQLSTPSDSSDAIGPAPKSTNKPSAITDPIVQSKPSTSANNRPPVDSPKSLRSEDDFQFNNSNTNNGHQDEAPDDDRPKVHKRGPHARSDAVNQNGNADNNNKSLRPIDESGSSTSLPTDSSSSEQRPAPPTSNRLDPLPLAVKDIPKSELKHHYQEAVANLQKEQQRLEITDQKLTRVQKELKMINDELQLKTRSYAEDLEKLRAENDDLRRRLREKADQDSTFEIDSANYARMESAVSAAKVFQQRIEQMTSEMEQREKQHQEMYLVMFRKGQEAAKMDMATSMELDPGNLAAAASAESSVNNRSIEEKSAEKSRHELEAHMRRDYVAKTGDSDASLSKDEIALHFLRDAVYYFLIDRDPKNHLQAIMNILKFSERQRQDVSKTKGV